MTHIFTVFGEKLCFIIKLHYSLSRPLHLKKYEVQAKYKSFMNELFKSFILRMLIHINTRNQRAEIFIQFLAALRLNRYDVSATLSIYMKVCT